MRFRPTIFFKSTLLNSNNYCTTLSPLEHSDGGQFSVMQCFAYKINPVLQFIAVQSLWLFLLCFAAVNRRKRRSAEYAPNHYLDHLHLLEWDYRHEAFQLARWCSLTMFFRQTIHVLLCVLSTCQKWTCWSSISTWWYRISSANIANIAKAA